MTHSSILPIFSNSLPVEDDSCHRVLHFMCQCLNTNCASVNFAARNGIFYSGMLSPVGRIIAFCSRRYRLNINLCFLVFLKRCWLRGSGSAPMNFICDGFVCGLLMVSICFQHLLVICGEILLKMQESIFSMNILSFTMSIFQSGVQTM